MNINLDGKDYEIDETDKKNATLMGILVIVRIGDNALPLIQHIQHCVQAIHSGKLKELRDALPEEAKETKPKK